MTNPWSISLLVGLGGFVGSMARYGLGVVSQRFTTAWPLGTLAANVLGCLAIGILAGLSAQGKILSPELRFALVTGFCGGFTTMSSMVYEAAEMIRASAYLHATAYVVGTFFLSMTAFVVGAIVLRLVSKIGGGVWN